MAWMASDPPTWVVLAGGRGSRMGGVKVELELAGRRLVDHVVDAIPAGDPVIVVGPPLEISREVEFCREEPAFGGPVAALAAALPRIGTDGFVLIAADMPWAVPIALDLIALRTDADLVIAVDHEGRPQPMCSWWRTVAAHAAIDSLDAVEGRSLMSLVDRMQSRRVMVDDPSALVDLDTPGDLAAARASREGLGPDS